MVNKKSFFEKVEAEVVSAGKAYLGEKIKKNLIKFGEVSVLIVLAIFLITFGIGDLIGFYFPILANGLNYLILGVLFLVVGMLLSR
jgi:uncharacterized membrane protein YkvI